MTLTADQLYRTAAAWTDFELKFFVGADRLLGDIQLTAGGAYDPEASTTLTADVTYDEVDAISVVSTTGFNTGFIVIHPYEAGESYELIAYSGVTSTTFTGLTRYEDDVNKKTHGSGATVSEWLEVTDYIYGNMNLDLFLDNEIGEWDTRINGHSYSGSLFQPDRAFLCMWRFRPADQELDDWTSWSVGYLGFLESVTVKGDWTEGNDWEASVVSLGHYLDRTDIGSGVTYGKIDLAEEKTVDVSSTLVNVYQEAASNEFVGTPSLGGEMAVDADIGTLWISDGEPQATVETPQNSLGNVNEVYLRTPSWMPDDLMWFEVFCATEYFGGKAAASCTVWGWTGWDPNGREPVNNYIGLAKGSPSGDDGYFAIYTNDRPKFLAHFPTCECDVYDWRPRQVGTFTLDPTGDYLALQRGGVNTADVVWWDGGRASWGLYDFKGGGADDYYKLGGTNFSGWTGDMITVPPVGHSFRSDPTGSHGNPLIGTGGVAYYEEDEDHPTPGYYLTGTREWIIVDLGTLGIDLAAALAQGVTTEAELTGHLGLTDSGYISIDTGGASHEIVKYNSIDRISNKVIGLTRGQAGTSDQGHNADESVQQYEDGAATDVPLIQSVQLKRRPVLIVGSTWRYNTILDFDVYDTIYSTGYPTPGGDGWSTWWNWWKRFAGVRGYTQTTWQKTLSSARRARKVMLSIIRMRDEGRAKLNEFSVFSSSGSIITAGDEDGSWSGGYSSDIIVHLLQTWFGVATDDITVSAEGRQVYKLDVTKDRIGQALRDLSNSAGTVVLFRLDNKIEIDWNTQIGAGGWPDVTMGWTRANTRDIEFSRQTRTDVAQVVVRLTNLEEEETYEAAWPANALAIGDVIEVSDSLLVGDGDDAKDIAQMLFNSKQLTDTVNITVKGIAEWALPGQRHTVTYLVDSDQTYLAGQNVIVTSVSHAVSLGEPDGSGKSWVTRIQAKRVEYA